MINLRKKEEIYLIKRRHHFVLIKSLLPVILIFLSVIILMFVSFFININFPDFMAESFPFLLEYKTRVLIVYLSTLFLIVLWQTAFIILANYYLDCWVVTDERAIHTELRSLFSRFLSSVPLHRVQDITVDVRGILPTFLRYGDLQIQTAGKFQEFTFRQIPRPYDTKEVIFKAQAKYFRKIRRRGLKDKELDEQDLIPEIDDRLPESDNQI